MHSANACLVYGGGTSGLMCEVAGNLVKLSGTESVRGVTCKQLMAKERKPGAEDATGPVEASKPESYGDLTVMDSLSARKDLMIGCVNEYPDSTGGFVALSGGFGMADEVMYVIAGRNLGMHKKRVVLVNVEGHWDHILAWARQAQDGRFVRASTMEWVLKAKSAEEAVRMLLE